MAQDFVTCVQKNAAASFGACSSSGARKITQGTISDVVKERTRELNTRDFLHEVLIQTCLPENGIRTSLSSVFLLLSAYWVPCTLPGTRTPLGHVKFLV